MSSGYSSLEEDSEEYFFTARTSFFKKPLGKVTETKVKSQKVPFPSNERVWQGRFIRPLRRSVWLRSPFDELQNEPLFKSVA